MGGGMILDHLTVASARPRELIDVAVGAGFDGVGLFLHAMPEVPGMMDYDLVHDGAARRACRSAAEDAGCRIAMAYPFTVSRSSQFADFLPNLDAAADVGARAVNLLVFDPDRTRRVDAICAISDAAALRGLSVGIEFFPASALRSFGEALALCDEVGGDVGITLDLLHLARSGGDAETLRGHHSRLLLVQTCDASAAAPEDLFAEASYARLLPGQGVLDCRALIEACGPDVSVSIEAPRGDGAGRSIQALARDAHAALAAVHPFLSPAAAMPRSAQ